MGERRRRRVGEVTALHRRLLERRREAEAAAPRPEWGCFEWSADGRYPRAAARRVYASRARAEAYSRPRDLVARRIQD